MTVGDMLTLLEEYDEDTEVMIAEQPHYPLVSTIKGVVEIDDSDDEDAIEDRGKVVYILEGQNEGYGCKEWWDMCSSIW